MTAGKLIEYLSKFPPTTNVYISGYEGGVEDLEEIKIISVARFVNSGAWNGKHERMLSPEVEKEYRENNHVIDTGIYFERQSS